MSEASLMGGDAGAAPSAPAAEAAPAVTEAPATDTSNQGDITLDTGVTAPEWLPEGVDSDISLDPSLRAIKDLPSLVKSYVHAQKKMGVKGVQIPTKDSSREEWDAFYQKMGKPTTLEEYAVQAPEENVVGEDFLNQFKQTAYEQNLLPDQAQAMFDFLNANGQSQLEAMETQKQEQVTAAIDGLKQEWGEAFDRNVHRAQVAVAEFGGDDLKAYLNETGLGNDPRLIKVFAKMGEQFMQEDTTNPEAKPAYAMSPDEAHAKINAYLGDFDGPYYNSNHPDHKRTVDEVQKLWQVVG
jgi:hypothetical protein